MVHGVVRLITTQPLLYPPYYNTCGLNLVLLTSCILTTNLQIAIQGFAESLQQNLGDPRPKTLPYLEE